jgi:phosphatidylserine decarboxylase
MPIMGENSLLLDACCWDKDRFGKDYMGEFNISVEDIFTDQNTTQEVWSKQGMSLRHFC